MPGPTTPTAAPAKDSRTVGERPEGWWAYPPVHIALLWGAGHIPGISWGWAALSGILLAVAGVIVAHLLWDPIDYGDVLPRALAGCLGLAGLCSGVWLVAAQILGQRAVWQHLIVGGGVEWVWWAVAMAALPAAARRHGAVTAVAAPPSATPAGPSVDDVKVLEYRGALGKALDGCDIAEVRISPSGGVETVVIAPAENSDVTRVGFEARIGKVSTSLAKHMQRTRGLDLEEEDVTVEAGRNAAVWHLLVSTSSVLNRTVSYVPAVGPQRWAGPKLMGDWEDDQPMMLTFCHEEEGAAHGDGVATTGGGKTNWENNFIRRALECEDVEVWLIGVQKMHKLALPWLDPWLNGRTDRPAIDWVAGESVMASLRALAALYHFAALTNRATRGNQARKASRGKGAILAILDEKSHLLKRPEVVRCHDGVKRNASELVNAVKQLARTSLVSVFTANQDKLFGSDGVEGSQSARNSKIGLVGRVQSGHDALAAIPNLSPRLNAMKLTDHACYMQTAYDPPRQVRGKFAMIPDEDIPAAAENLTQYRYGLDPTIMSKVIYYNERWHRTWHLDLVDMLEEDGLAWPPDTASATAGASVPPASRGTLDEPTPDAARGDAPHEETAPMSDPTPNPRPDEPAPSGDTVTPLPDDDVWGFFDSQFGDVDPTDTPATPAGLDALYNPDLTDVNAGVAKMQAWVENELARRRAADDTADVPDPLGSVLAILALPKAPRDFVPAVVLALALQRVTPDADDDAKWRAAAQLGRDLTAQCPALERAKAQKRMGKDGDGKDVRVRGYSVPGILEAAKTL